MGNSLCEDTTPENGGNFWGRYFPHVTHSSTKKTPKIYFNHGKTCDQQLSLSHCDNYCGWGQGGYERIVLKAY